MLKPNSIENNILLKLLFFSSVCIIILFFVLSFYAHPSADDFTYAWKVQQYGIIGTCLREYNFWNGTIVSNLLISGLAGINKFHLYYFIVPIVVILLFLYSLFMFINAISGYLISKPEYKYWIRYFTVVVAALMLSTAPKIAQSIYFASGAFKYTIANIFVLILFSLLIKVKKYIHHERIKYLVIILTGVLLSCLNEIASVIYLSLLILLIMLTYKKKSLNDLRSRLFSALTGMLIGLLFVVTAPGNIVRLLAETPSGLNRDILFSVWQGIKGSFISLGQINFVYSPILLIFFCFLLFLFIILLQQKIIIPLQYFKNIYPANFTILFVVYSFFITQLIYVLSKGELVPWRVILIVPLFVWIWTGILIAYNIAVILLGNKYFIKIPYKIFNCLIVILLIYNIFIIGSIMHNIPKYWLFNQQMHKRYILLESNNSKEEIILSKLTYTPWPIFNKDIVGKHTSKDRIWINQAVARYFKKNMVWLED